MSASVDEKRIKELILEQFQRQHKLGETAGGSEHLGFTSVTRIDVGKPRETKINKQPAIEMSFTVETYTETEFLHSPDDDVFYTKKYAGTIAVDASMNVLRFSSE
nr:hypothetical protein [Candidatus Sigynarchaeum springense]